MVGCLYLEFKSKLKDFGCWEKHFVKEVKTVAAALKFGAIRNRDNTTTASDRLVSAFLSVLASENANFQSGLGLTLSDGIFKSD